MIHAADLAEAIAMGPDPELLRLIESSLEFTYGYGDVTPVAPPHDTGWRTLPFLVTAAADSEGVVDVEGRPSIRGRDLGALCVAPGIHHRCRVTGASGISRWSCTTYTILQGIDLFALVEPKLMIPGDAGRRIGAINAELAALAREPAPSLRRIARTRELGFALLAIVLDHAEWRPHRDQLAVNAQRLVPVFEFIRRNLGRRLTVAELARQARLSAPRFHALFRRATGVSPH